MKYCNKCKVNVAGNCEKCPLCQNELIVLDDKEKADRFPRINKKGNKIDLVWRIFIMASVFVIFVCSIINYSFPQNGLWCRFVAEGLFTSWIFLFVVMKEYKNILKCLFYETIVVSCFVVAWDYYTGMHGWSLDFVLPIIFITIIVAMGILAKVLRIAPEDHIIYLLSLSTFGIIPGFFWANNMLHIELPSMICIGMSLILVFALILFEGKKMLQEFSRRLHI